MCVLLILQVLRTQPDNIYEYGALYFTELLDQLAMAEAARNEVAAPLSAADIEEILKDLFKQVDREGSGALSISEFKVW